MFIMPVFTRFGYPAHVVTNNYYTFLVEIDDNVMWKRHSNQMIECSPEVFSETKPASDNSVNIEQTVLRRSERLKEKQKA